MCLTYCGEKDLNLHELTLTSTSSLGLSKSRAINRTQTSITTRQYLLSKKDLTVTSILKHYQELSGVGSGNWGKFAEKVRHLVRHY